DFQFTNTVLSAPSVEFTSSTPSQLKSILKQSKLHQSPAPNPSESILIKQDGEKNGEQAKQNVEDLSNKGKSLARRGVGQLLLQLKGEPNSTPDTTFKMPENNKKPPQVTTCTPSTSELKNESQPEENAVPITNKTTPVLSNKVD
uniref:Uncharacterized protein n=1 Tax=Ciona savignyi TaxID=51511 RepID=H2ZII7_CIOSA